MSDFPTIIPDALLAWGNTPEVAVHFPRPWASMLDDLIAKGDLTRRETKMFMARLEALCAEAIRAGRAELLAGLDTRTAEYLGLSYAITLADGRVVEIGKGKRYTWAEMRQILAAEDPKAAVRAVERVKDLLSESFLDARIGEVVSDSSEEADQACASCGTTTNQVMIATEHGTHHCGRCWLLMTDQTPVNYKLKTKTIRGKR